jgi:hypothetical protein
MANKLIIIVLLFINTGLFLLTNSQQSQIFSNSHYLKTTVTVSPIIESLQPFINKEIMEIFILPSKNYGKN